MKNELRHHGILGQKWGIRRYQNSDGSLTDEGRKRYGSLSGIHKEFILKNIALNIENSDEYKQFISDIENDNKKYDADILKFNDIGSEYDHLTNDEQKIYDDIYKYLYGGFDNTDKTYTSEIEKIIKDKGLKNNYKEMGVESFEYYKGGKGMYVYAKEPSVINALNGSIKFYYDKGNIVNALVDKKLDTYFGSEYISNLKKTG